MVVDLVWMGGLFGFLSAYVYYIAIASGSGKSHPFKEQVSEKST